MLSISFTYIVGTNRHLHLLVYQSLNIVYEYIETPVFYVNTFLHRIVSVFIATEKYEQRIADLERMVLEYERLKMQLEFLQIENNHLERLLNFTDRFQYEKVTAKLFVTQNLIYLNFGTINAGVHEGIKNNSVVVSDIGLVGRVVDVFEHDARVLMITDPNSKVPVIGLKSKQRGIFVGNRADAGLVLYIEDAHMLEIGEVLVTSGDDSYFIEGIPVAKVSKIDHDVVYAEHFLTKNSIVTAITKNR